MLFITANKFKIKNQKKPTVVKQNQMSTSIPQNNLNITQITRKQNDKYYVIINDNKNIIEMSKSVRICASFSICSECALNDYKLIPNVLWREKSKTRLPHGIEFIRCDG